MNYLIKFKKIFLIISVLIFLPQTVSATTTLTDLITAATNLVQNILIPLAFALCLFYFFWGVAKYIKKGAGDEKAAMEGRRIMGWGLVGVFVAFSIWGIISFIQTELQIPDVQNVEKPTITDVTSTITF